MSDQKFATVLCELSKSVKDIKIVDSENVESSRTSGHSRLPLETQPSFESKPLNKKGINFADSYSPPRKVKKIIENERNAVRGVSHEIDEKKFLSLLRKEREKRKTIGKHHTSRKREVQIPVQKATSVRHGYRHNTPFIECAEPQMMRSIFSPTISLGEGVGDVVANLQNSVDQITTAMREARVSVGLDDSASEKVDKLGKFTEFASFMVVVTLILVVRPTTAVEKTLVSAAVMGFLASKINLSDVISKSGIMSWLRSETVVSQAAKSSIADEISDLVCAAVNLYVCRSYGSDLLKPKEFVRIVSQISRTAPTVNSIVKGVNILVSYVLKSVERRMSGEDFVRTGYPFIDSFLKEYNLIVDAFEKKELFNRQSSVDRVKSAISYGESIAYKLPGGGEFATIRVGLMQSLVELKKIRTKLMSSNFNFAGVRTEPSSLLFRGLPGVFKSQAMQHVAHAVSARTMNDDDFARYCESPTTFSYNRQAENVYWDGYSQERHVVMFDDICQARDIQGNPDNEAMNLIRAMNIFEFNLHMAALEDKGVSLFRSLFVLANTNMKNFQLDSIHEIGAFLRRWDVVVDVVPKPEYARDPNAPPDKRRFDPSKFPKYDIDNCGGKVQLIGTTRAHPDMCEFHLQYLNEECTSFLDAGTVLTFDEVIERYVAVYKQKCLWNDGYMVDLDATLKKYRKIKEDLEEPMKEDVEMFSIFDGSRDTEKIVSQGDFAHIEENGLASIWHYEVLFPAVHPDDMIYRVEQVRIAPKQNVEALSFLIAMCTKDMTNQQILSLVPLIIKKIELFFYTEGDIIVEFTRDYLNFTAYVLTEVIDLLNGFLDEVDPDDDFVYFYVRHEQSGSNEGLRVVYDREWKTLSVVDGHDVRITPVFEKEEEDSSGERIVSQMESLDVGSEQLRKYNVVFPLVDFTELRANLCVEQLIRLHEKNPAAAKAVYYFCGILQWCDGVSPAERVSFVVRILEAFLSRDLGFDIWVDEVQLPFEDLSALLDAFSKYPVRKCIVPEGFAVYIEEGSKALVTPGKYLGSTIELHWEETRFKEVGFAGLKFNVSKNKKPRMSGDFSEVARMLEKVGEFPEAQYVLEPVNQGYMNHLKMFATMRYHALHATIVGSMIVGLTRYDMDYDVDDIFRTARNVLESHPEFYSSPSNLRIDEAVELTVAKYTSERRLSKLFRPDPTKWEILKEKAMESLSGLKKVLHELYHHGLTFLSVLHQSFGNVLAEVKFGSFCLWDSVPDFVKTGFVLILVPAAATLAAVASMQIISFVTRMFGGCFGKSKEESHAPYERMSKVGRSRKMRRPPKPSITSHSMVGMNANLSNVIDTVFQNQLFEVWFPVAREGASEEDDVVHTRVGFCLAVKGRVMMMPWHFYSSLGSNRYSDLLLGKDEVYFRRPNSDIVHFIVEVDEFLEGVSLWDKGDMQDIVMVVMPKRYQPHRSMIHHFVDKKRMDNYTKCRAMLVIPSKKHVLELQSFPAVRQGKICVENEDIDAFDVEDVLRYDADTSYGDCGAPCLVNDKSSNRCVIGMHIAGASDRGVGYSSVLTQEWVKEYYEFTGDGYVDPPLPFEPDPVEKIVSNMAVVGVAPVGVRTPRQVGSSAWSKSLLFGEVYKSPKGLSRLRPFFIDGVRVDPLADALKEYSPSCIHIPEDLVEKATHQLFDYLYHVSTLPVVKKIMSFDEAVLGDGPGSEFGPIPRTTSAGYPYNVMGSPSNKTRFFGSGEEYVLDSTECKILRAEVAQLELDARRGIRGCHVFTDSLKDERRSLQKVALGKTRLFSGCPLKLLILTRQYFGSFAKWIVRNRILNGVAIGVNEYSGEWVTIARQLNQFGRGANKGAGDFKGLDKNEFPIIHNAILRYVNAWYDDGPENAKVRETLLLDLTNSMHLAEGVLYHWNSSMPSGHFLTALFNSLYVHILFRMSWMRVVENFYNYPFEKHVFLIVLGDDNVYSVSDQFKEVFTEKRLAMEMARFGQTYTPEDKEKVAHGKSLRTLEEVTFLKRAWKVHELSGVYVGPLELSSVLDVLNWTKKGGNPIGDLETNIRVCLEELTLHGKEVFDHWKVKLLLAIDKVPGLSRPSSTRFDEIFRDVCTRGEDQAIYAKFLSGYESEGGNSMVIQSQSIRFLRTERPGLFSLTSRMGRRQSRQYPGTHGGPKALARASDFTRAAPQMNMDGDDGARNEVRVDEGLSDVQANTTQSVAESGVVINKPVYTPLDPSILDSARTGVANEIKDFLQRPRVLTTGTLGTTDVANVSKWSALVPNDLINSAGDIWQNKLAGTLAFRGELHLTLQVNGNRFQQGRYILAWVPTGGGFAYDWFVKTHSATLTEVTQLPHVELDINCDTEATLVIPFVNAMGWAHVSTLNISLGNVGKVLLLPYSPLVAPAGSTTANYSIFAHFEKVEIAMPVVPQMSGRAKTRVRRRPRPAEVEEKVGGIGPIEATAVKVRTMATNVVGIPLLASVAGPVAWAANLAANVSSAFGWSRPRNEAPAQFMNKVVMHRLGNVDAPDNSAKLGFSDRNEIEDLPSFAGNGIDEMSIKYVSGISAYYRQFNWQTGQAVGTNVFTEVVSPRHMYRTTSQASQTVYHLPPLAYCARFFGLWRGTIRFTFKLIKTEFHSGRLAVSFVPYDSTTSPTVNINNSTYLHRQILDVREGNEFVVECPWMSFSQYKPTMASAYSCCGALNIHVLNSLVAPANVSSTVVVLVEVSAGDDIEFAQPCYVSGRPTMQIVPQMARNDCQIIDAPIGEAAEGEKSVSARVAIGERVVSFRQVLKRFSQLLSTAYPATTSNRYITFYPGGIAMDQLDSVPAYKVSAVRPDTYDNVACCYAMFRGSMRWKVFNEDKSYDPHLLAASHVMAPGATMSSVFSLSSGVPFGIPADTIGRSLSVFRGDATGGAEVEIPFYNTYHSAAVSDMVACDTASSPFVQINASNANSKAAAYILNTDQSASATFTPLLFRAIGEDASLGLFVSTVPLIGYNADSWG